MGDMGDDMGNINVMDGMQADENVDVVTDHNGPCRHLSIVCPQLSTQMFDVINPACTRPHKDLQWLGRSQAATRGCQRSASKEEVKGRRQTRQARCMSTCGMVLHDVRFVRRLNDPSQQATLPVQAMLMQSAQQHSSNRSWKRITTR